MLSWIDSRAIRIDTVSPDPVRRMAALLATDAAGADRISERLRLSNRQRDRLRAMVAPSCPVDPDQPEAAMMRTLHRLGPETARDLTLLAWADELNSAARLPRGRNVRWAELLHWIDAWRPIAFPLLGRDALKLGVPPGPSMGRLLREVEGWWEEGGYRADHAACLDRLRALVAAGD
jgi:poly(A) polymerase